MAISQFLYENLLHYAETVGFFISLLLFLTLFVLNRGKKTALGLSFPMLALGMSVFLFTIGMLVEKSGPGSSTIVQSGKEVTWSNFHRICQQYRIADRIEILAIAMVALALARLLISFIVDVIFTRVLKRPVARIVVDVTQIVLYATLAFATLPQLGFDARSVFLTSSLLTAVVGFALRDTIANFVAGLTIQVQREFALGDWIKIEQRNDIIGKVTETSWWATKIVTTENTEIIVPNLVFARNPVTNYSNPSPPIRRSIYVSAPYQVPPTVVKTAIESILLDIPEVHKELAPSVITYQFLDNGTIQYWIRYFIKDRDFPNRDRIDGIVRDRIWFALDRADVGYPLPTSIEYSSPNFDELKRWSPKDNFNSVLEKTGLFDAIPDDQRAGLYQTFTHRRFAPGETILRQGEIGRDMFVIVKGEAIVTVNGTEVARLGKGRFFGEMALLTGNARRATVMAQTAIDTVVIGEKNLRGWLEKYPTMVDSLSEAIAQRQREIDSKISSQPEPEEAQPLSPGLMEKIRKVFGNGTH